MSSSPELAESPIGGPSTTTTAAPTSKPTKPSGGKGTTLFPIARVSRIIKADGDVDICSKEATFLISIATEIFIRKLTDEAYTNAKLDKRKHVFYKDLSRAVQQGEWLEFLKEIVPGSVSLSSALEKRGERLAMKEREVEMILDGTLQDEDEEEEEAEEKEEEDADEEEEAGEQVDEGEAEVAEQVEEETAAAEEEVEPTAKPSKKKSRSKKKKPAAKAQDAQAHDDEVMDEDAA